MSATVERLREELKDGEYSEGYAESFLDSYIATQIKVLREQAGLSQTGLAEKLGTRQGVISRIENVNYSKWNVSTLKKLARAFRVRLKVSFETYGSLLADVSTFSRESLQREPRECDPILNSPIPLVPSRVVLRKHVSRASTSRQFLTLSTGSNSLDTRFFNAPHHSSLGQLGSQIAARRTSAEQAQGRG
jgi:transcriptional regulator with XRE-family HTH domain